MLLPVKWLRDYVNIDKDVKIIADEITATGSHVESIENRAENLSKVVVGKIEKIEKHPDAEKLVVCSVNVGTEILQIVTGAKNVYEGAVVPVALVGAHLSGGVKISKGKLRGVESYGMLCSLGELGYDNSVISKEAKDGIFLFPEGTEIGKSAISVLDLDKEIIEIEITPNRPDCLSIIGMARETAATFDMELSEPKIDILNEVDDIADYFNTVDIETENCDRFYARVLKNVKIETSPLWLQNYLVSAGVRPINNIVDLTNFVMLEYGQPLHAYDLDDLQDKKIVVRQAKNGEVIKTLDDEDRLLEEKDIVIADGKRAIGLAGIMGGFDSEIKDNTVNVLLEGANFDADSIRKTSKRLQLRSEASARFEKGIDINAPKIAVDRVCQLAEKINAAQVVKGSIDNYRKVREIADLNLRVEKCNRLIGFELNAEEIAGLLNRLQINTDINGEVITAHIPTFRLDIEIEEDLIEEVARIYGYHNIIPKPLEGSLTVGGRSELRNLEDRIKKVLLSIGYSEFMTYSFVSPSNFDKLMLDETDDKRKVVKIINPLGEEYSIMRTTLVSNMLEVLSKNEHRGNEYVAGFEFGNTFIPQGEGLPREELKLSMGFYDMGDFYFLKESIRRALWQVGILNLEYKRANINYLHPGRSAEIYVDGKYIGVFGEVHPLVAKNYELKKKCYVAEIEFEKLLENSIENYKFRELPKYPAMRRDLAVVIDRDIDAGEIELIARKHGKKLLEEFKVFDVYTGENIESRKKSIAFSMTFRANDRTLVDKEVNDIVSKVVDDLSKEYGANLRA
ncbi:phenylalanine--tRNA ligase subunit beta [Peptoniphilus sp. oral taxon 386]|uniref:phenylalanine--tRNA ligase subunit beta n=1 Tax=Peptoniphilus sp. oral taxon 386 TaxID=652713 RepID=UPI0001DA9B3D|nr:phenylalanine--tRNA ligase subunit beta [Peptoniphilus sp. oral taxon 386]EFI42135.1 phenylalanine--tRNA ligase, beta subunit [Peptoniphilus sp. oral taxon 386 str. F0131]